MDKVTAAKKEYRLMEWAGLTRERAESGETVKDFCAARGLSPKTYYYRLRKVRETMLPVVAAEVQAVVPVGGAHTPAQPVSVTAVILRAGELTAELSNTATAQQIRALVLALREPC